jgi:hypothetical protein
MEDVMNKILNPKESVFKPLENKSSKKANEVFIKLLVKHKKPKNPFDEARSYTTPSMKETKPGPDYA